jgi:hypothetical protein
MANYEYVGTLKSGRHTVVALDRVFEAGDEVPLTEAETKLFAHRFDNVRKAKAVELKALTAEA